MMPFKKVCFVKDGKPLVLRNLNHDNLKIIMKQNQFNTVILDPTKDRFLFYDCIDNVADKYELYDLSVLSKSSESFDMIILLKSDENKIKDKIELAEKYRIGCGVSILENENEQQQQEKIHQIFVIQRLIILIYVKSMNNDIKNIKSISRKQFFK